MKHALAYILLSALLMLSMAGCVKSEPLTEPIALESFTFMARGSSTNEIYSYSAKKTAEGTQLYLEMNCGYEVVDITVQEDVLGALGEIAAKHRIDMWDGFEKSKNNVSDGRGFTLYMTTADGREISAHGSNAFPKGYSEAKADIDALFAPFVR